MQRATTLADIKKVLAPKPLTLAQLDPFFVETSDARDVRVPRRTELADSLASRDDAKVLVAGHSGTGKSTELVKFQEEHTDRYVVVRLSVLEEALFGKVSIEPLLVLLVETLLRTVSELGGTWDEETLRRVYGWFSETFRYDESSETEALTTGGKLDSSDTYLGKLLGLGAWLKADIKAGCSVVNRTITKENRRLTELVQQCNTLVRGARSRLRDKLKRELLLVVEDLDKVSLREANELFIDNPAPLASLDAKALLTAPIFLLCSPRAANMSGHFQRVIIPMIKVRDRDGERCPEGWRAVRDILERRLDVDRLIHPEALDDAIDKTGGVLRHLFDVLTIATRATTHALARNPERGDHRVNREEVRYGLDRVKNELVVRKSDIGIPEEYSDVRAADLDRRVRELRGKTTTASPDRVSLFLLEGHALIEYDGGESWYRLHPLIEEHIAGLD